jgi:hypothetical protein
MPSVPIDMPSEIVGVPKVCGLPPAAMYCLSGRICSQFTCLSGCASERWHAPEDASQKRIVWS